MPHNTASATLRKAGPATPASKPPKPYAGFPLGAHGSGHWCKKIRGTVRYFGPWAKRVNGQLEALPDFGWQAALEKYNEQRDDLQAGRTPSSKEPDNRPTLRLLCDKFLQYKNGKIGIKLGQRMFDEYRLTVDRLLEKFGKLTLVEELKPHDFAGLMTDLEKAFGVVRRGNEVGKVKTIFLWGQKHGIIKTLPAYGDFDKPTKDELRRHRAKNGKKLFEAAELRKLIASAPVPLRAMLLLGVNAGLGNHDCATLPLTAVKLDTGWIEYPRPKNGIERRCPLWSETITALKDAIAERPKTNAEDAKDKVFLTSRKRPWLSRGIANPISVATRDLMKAAGVHKRGLGFYTLRHVFRTVADAAKDIPATRLIMGHADGTIDSVYREHIDDDRLEAVTNHVRNWLYPQAKAVAR